MQHKLQLFREDKHKASKYLIYTDGACEPNPGIGGWGYVVFEDGVESTKLCGGSLRTTNNIMEMTGVLQALIFAKASGMKALETLIKTDSMYVVNGCMLWRHSWKKKGWRRSVKNELANSDLWKNIDAALIAFPCKIEWVKGHAGNRGNEMADKLAELGRNGVVKNHETKNNSRDAADIWLEQHTSGGYF